MNLAPQEIEEAVEALPFVRRAAAVGIDRGRAEGEQAYVFAELRRAKPPPLEDLEEMARQVVVSFHERLGLRPGRVVLLAPRAIPLTANGKLRHAALRRAWLDGTLRAEGRILFPEG
jgi:acyl-coenzyme A synthetase/AMP-(fatty) acid ligase